MDNTYEMDPWANMGNMTNSKAGEVSPEGLAREAAWNNTMADAPDFGGTTPAAPNPLTTDNEAPARDENIADAALIINYGLNAAAREVGVEATIQAINNFVPDDEQSPTQQLFTDLGIDTAKEFKDLADESRAAKPAEIAFRNESVNAPATTKKSPEGAMYAIKEVKELVAEVQTSPAYANLREEALRNNKGIFEYAVSKYPVRDLTTLFNVLSEQKNTYEKSLNQKPAQETPANEEKLDDTQIENQSSTENPSPDTEATAINKSLF